MIDGEIEVEITDEDVESKMDYSKIGLIPFTVAKN